MLHAGARQCGQSDSGNPGGRFTQPTEALAGQDVYWENDVGVTHPILGSFIRINGHGDIMLHVQGVDIHMNTAQRRITFSAGDLQVLAKSIFWNKAQFDPTSFSFSGSALMPTDFTARSYIKSVDKLVGGQISTEGIRPTEQVSPRRPMALRGQSATTESSGVMQQTSERIAPEMTSYTPPETPVVFSNSGGVNSESARPSTIAISTALPPLQQIKRTGIICLADGASPNYASPYSSSNVAGAPGSASNSIGDITYSGGQGYNPGGDVNTGGGGGSSAGISSNGINALSRTGATAPTGGGRGGTGASSVSVATDGANPGGGGGGEYWDGGTRNAYGQPSGGKVVLTFNDSANTVATYTVLNNNANQANQTYTVSVPTGATQVVAQCWGSGSPGVRGFTISSYLGTTTYNGGEGGAGGAYAQTTWQLGDATSLQVQVGGINATWNSTISTNESYVKVL